MSDAQKLILEALRKSLPPFDGFDHACAVAAAGVDKALGGLTREQRTLHNGWVQPGYGAMYYAQGMTPPPAVITNETRWVSTWKEVTE